MQTCLFCQSELTEVELPAPYAGRKMQMYGDVDMEQRNYDRLHPETLKDSFRSIGCSNENCGKDYKIITSNMLDAINELYASNGKDLIKDKIEDILFRRFGDINVEYFKNNIFVIRGEQSVRFSGTQEDFVNITWEICEEKLASKISR